MGDVLLAVPAARALLGQGKLVHWVLHRRWEALAEFLPARVHLVSGLTDVLPLARRLRALHPLRVHDLQGKGLSIFLTWAIGQPVTRYDKRSSAESLNAVLGKYPLRGSDPQPVWNRYLSTVAAEETSPNPTLVLSPAYLQECENFLTQDLHLKSRQFLAIHPGASHPGKILP